MQNKVPELTELEEVISAYKRTVYGIALTQLNNRFEADDVFQEVFLLYFTKSPEFEDEGARRAWLIRATVNKCRQYNLGKWNRNIDKSAELDESLATRLDTAEESELMSAVTGLAPKYREVVYLRCFIGLSAGETAKALGISAGAVNVRLNRAKKQLKKRLEREYFEE